MKRILIVEDDVKKAEAVKIKINQIVGCKTEIEIKHVESTISAKRMFAESYFDLCILDLNLPLRDGEDPVKNEGSTLLDELHDMDHVYKVPRNIVGLTGYSEEFDFANTKFTNYLFHILFYDPSSNEWSQRLEHLLKRILKDTDEEKLKEINDTICLVTALDELELSSILNLPWSWEDLNIPEDPTHYYRTLVDQHDGNYITIIVASANHMGMPSSIPLAMKMINHFTPKYIAMTGITGGKKGSVNLGDAIVPDCCWDWGSGKYVVDEATNKSVFKPEPRQILLSTELKQKFQRLGRDEEVFESVRNDWKGDFPNGHFKVHVGPHASGAAVLDDPKLLEQIEGVNRKILGYEMEAYGIFTSAINSCYPQPTAFVIKSVSDFADGQKNDNFQQYSAYTSAKIFQLFVEKYL